MLVEKAPAKVNLTLHVLGRRADGYHELESLVAFAGTGDTLTLRPCAAWSLAVSGEGAAATGPVDDNLVLKAARHLRDAQPRIHGGAFHLVKRLPSAAGIGGGSSDAAAALRLLARLNGLPLDHPALAEAARRTGADVRVCLRPRLQFMRGIGADVAAVEGAGAFFALLANPRRPVATPAVFGALGLRQGDGHGAPMQKAAPSLAHIAACRNDLEAPALAVEPAIGAALNVLRELPGARLARMSGSGATCFALFDDGRAAIRAAALLRGQEPGWWIKATVLR